MPVTGWLLDTNIVRLLAPGWNGQPKGGPDFNERVRQNADCLFLSVISVAEISAGIRKLRRAGAERSASDVDIWLDGIVAHYGERILAIDTKVAKVAGELAEEGRANRRDRRLSDILVAATARAHGHGLWTDNIKHFKPLMFGLPLLNPLEHALPGRP